MKILITVTGNTVIDALQWVLKRIDKDKDRQKNLENILNANYPLIGKIKILF